MWQGFNRGLKNWKFENVKANCKSPVFLIYGLIGCAEQLSAFKEKVKAVKEEEPGYLVLGPNISAAEADFHSESSLSLAGWGSLWYENRANLSASDCCHVFILQTSCPFINLWLVLEFLKRLVLNGLIRDWQWCRSEKTHFVSHRYFVVLNGTTAKLCNSQWRGGLVSPLTWRLIDQEKKTSRR